MILVKEINNFMIYITLLVHIYLTDVGTLSHKEILEILSTPFHNHNCTHLKNRMP